MPKYGISADEFHSLLILFRKDHGTKRIYMAMFNNPGPGAVDGCNKRQTEAKRWPAYSLQRNERHNQQYQRGDATEQ